MPTPGALFLMGLASVGATAVAPLYHYFDLISKRGDEPSAERLKAMAEASVADATTGELARLRGRALPHGQTLYAPLSGERCIAWRVVIRGWRKRERVLVDERSFSDFWLRAEGGSILIRSGDDADLLDDRNFSTCRRAQAFPALDAFLRKNAPGLIRPGRLAYREILLRADDEVEAGGLIRLRHDAQGGGSYRQRERLLELGAAENVPVTIHARRRTR